MELAEGGESTLPYQNLKPLIKLEQDDNLSSNLLARHFQNNSFDDGNSRMMSKTGSEFFDKPKINFI